MLQMVVSALGVLPTGGLLMQRTVTAQVGADLAWPGLIAMISSSGFTAHPPDHANRQLMFYLPAIDGPWQCDVLARVGDLTGSMSSITLIANDGGAANISRRSEAAAIKTVASLLHETFRLSDKSVLHEEAPIDASSPATEITRPAVIIGAVVLLLVILMGFSW